MTYERAIEILQAWRTIANNVDGAETVRPTCQALAELSQALAKVVPNGLRDMFSTGVEVRGEEVHIWRWWLRGEFAELDITA